MAADRHPAGDVAGGVGTGDAEPDPYEVARTICLRLLERTARTRAELARELRRRRVPEDAATAALDRLTEVGLVDDAAFAVGFVGRRQERRTGPLAWRQELRRRGVADPLTAAAVATVSDDQLDAAARELVAARLPTVSRLDRPTRWRRLTGLLLRRGYPPELAYRVVRDALGSREEPPD